MTLQVLPPELLETQDRIETKEPQPYWKPSSLKDGESEEFRLLGCYETGHAIMGWQYASEIQDPKTGDLRFNGYVVTRSHPCLLYTSPSPRDGLLSRMPSSA